MNCLCPIAQSLNNDNGNNTNNTNNINNTSNNTNTIAVVDQGWNVEYCNYLSSKNDCQNNNIDNNEFFHFHIYCIPRINYEL